MKYAILGLLAATLLSSAAFAEDCKVPPVQHSKDFEKLKDLNGKWAGTGLMHGEQQDVAVDYHLTSGGSAVVETLFPGTPHEMVSVYHDDHGKLTMTHYCMLGNQPKLDLTKSTASEMDFNFGKGNTINPKSEMHMHALHIAFIDPDNIVENWSAYADGKQTDETIFKLQRLKSN